jgi:type II secretory ATPase GspE/PulE/Tfp pilus assembly ATPase PilB-like protein
MALTGVLQMEDDLRNQLGYTIERVAVWNDEVSQALVRFYPIAGLLPPGAQWRAEEYGPAPVHVAPLDLTIERLLQRAVQENASEIHLEPLWSQFRVRFRVERNRRQVLIEEATLPVQMGAALLAQSKCLAHLDVDERTFPQEGAAELSIGQQTWRVSISTLPTIHGESALLRLSQPQEED